MKKIAIVLLVMGLNLSFVTAARDTSEELDELFGGEPNVSINLGPQLLNLAAQFSDEADEIKSIIAGLDGLSVRVYELDNNDNSKAISRWLNDYVANTKGSNVTEIVKVVEDDERVHILASIDDNSINDLSILVYEEGDEFVHISLSGLIEMDSISDLLDEFDVNVAALGKISINR